MINFLTDISTPAKKFLLTFLMACLWLVSVGLWSFSIPALEQLLHGLIVLNMDPMQIVTTRGRLSLSRWFVYIVGGMMWMIAVLMAPYYFKYVGKIQPLKVLFWISLPPMIIILSNRLFWLFQT